MADLHGLLADPQFNGLSPDDQRVALSKVTGDSTFSSLSDGDLNQFKYKMGHTAGSQLAAQSPTSPQSAQTPSQGSYSVWDSLKTNFSPDSAYNYFVKPAVDAVKTIADPQLAEGRATWDALQGQGSFANMSRGARAQEAIAHGLGAVTPIVGPLAVHLGSNIGTGDYGGAALDAAGIGAAEFGPALLGKLRGAIPSASHAGQVLDQVLASAKDLPVPTENISPVIAKAQRLASAGGQLPKVLSDWVAQTGDGKAIDFQTARDFYSNGSRLSAEEYSRLTPAMQKHVRDFTRELGNSLTSSAEQLDSVTHIPMQSANTQVLPGTPISGVS